jgi:hypothetical protein
MKLGQITPDAAIPGGVVRLQVKGLEGVAGLRAEVGEAEAEFLGASTSALTLRIPDGVESDEIVIYHGDSRARKPFRLGRLLATGLHSVSNPVVDSRGLVYCTYSGSRGEKVPFSVYVIDPNGDKQAFLADITNPTGLAIGPDNHLYISSRHTGTVYRSSFDKQVEKYVDGLGLATGIAFNSKGDLIVGDRGGTVYRISPELDVRVLCELEPSVSAYHLTVGPDDSVFIAGPTLSTQDSIYRVSTDGEVTTFFRGLGRPQGLGFNAKGHLQVAASFRGRKGIYTLENGEPEWTVAGPMLIGFAYSPKKDVLYLVDSSQLYALSVAT